MGGIGEGHVDLGGVGEGHVELGGIGGGHVDLGGISIESLIEVSLYCSYLGSQFQHVSTTALAIEFYTYMYMRMFLVKVINTGYYNILGSWSDCPTYGV